MAPTALSVSSPTTPHESVVGAAPKYDHRAGDPGETEQGAGTTVKGYFVGPEAGATRDGELLARRRSITKARGGRVEATF